MSEDLKLIYTGSKVEALFLEEMLKENNIGSFLKNALDVDLEGRFTDEEQVDNTFLYVEIFNEQKAEKILKDYFDSRDKK
jgi:hypothetical protein